MQLLFLFDQAMLMKLSFVNYPTHNESNLLLLLL